MLLVLFVAGVMVSNVLFRSVMVMMSAEPYFVGIRKLTPTMLRIFDES